MRSELDDRLDAAIAAITGPGGPLRVSDGPPGAVTVAGVPETLAGFFDHFCAAHGDGTALVSGDERIGFAELGRASDAIAAALAGGHGVRKGDRVAIAMRNSPAWIAAYIGVVKAGAIAVLVNGWWLGAEAAECLALVAPSLVIADEPRAARLEAAGCPVPRLVLTIDRPLAEAIAPLVDGVAPGERPTLSPNDDATILFTSGSTGLAKGAVSTHRAVLTGAWTFLGYTAALLKIMTDEGRPPPNPPAALVAVPLFHVTGAVPLMLNSFAIGRKMVMMRRWDAGEALRLIEAEKVTYFVGVPTMSLELLQHPDRDRHDLGSLLDMAAGGGPRPAAHVARLAEAFPGTAPMLGYGLTETNAVGCTNFRANYLARPTSTGRAQRPFADVAVFDPDGRPLPAGADGEICIRSRANFRAYWNNPAATAAAFFGDWFRTGDLGHFDADGYLFIVDRAKDIIIRGGENIASQEVEAAIYTHPAVAEACVFGLPDERLGEVPVALVHPKNGATLATSELSAYLESRLARFKLPERLWLSADPLPKLGTGKIDKVALRRDYRALVEAEPV